MVNVELANLAEFEKALEDFPKRGYRRANMVLRASVTELMRRILRDTPVKTGRLKGAWRVGGAGGGAGFSSELGIQSRSFGLSQRRETSMEFDKSESGDKTLAKSKGAINSLNLENGNVSIEIYNNTYYAGFVEYGREGRPARHMLTRNITSWPAIVAQFAGMGGLSGYRGGDR